MGLGRRKREVGIGGSVGVGMVGSVSEVTTGRSLERSRSAKEVATTESEIDTLKCSWV